MAWYISDSIGPVDFVHISSDFTISQDTANNLTIDAQCNISLGTAYISKSITIASTVTYNIVVPTDVTVYYSGIPYNGMNLPVPSGYSMMLNQVSATVWFIHGQATL